MDFYRRKSLAAKKIVNKHKERVDNIWFENCKKKNKKKNLKGSKKTSSIDNLPFIQDSAVNIDGKMFIKIPNAQQL